MPLVVFSDQVELNKLHFGNLGDSDLIPINQPGLKLLT